jgi:hypothetical protein
MAINAATGLARTMTKGLGDLVTTLVQMTQSLSEGDIKKAGAVAQILGAVGQMMSGIQIPPELMKTITGTDKGTFGSETTTLVEKASDKIAAFGTAMTSVIGAIGPAISSIITEVKKIDIGKDPKEVKAFVVKIDAMSKLFTSLGGLSSMLTSMGATGTVDSKGTRGLDRLLEVFTNGKIQSLINAASALTMPTGLVTGTKVLETTPALFEKVSKAVKSGASLGEDMANATVSLGNIRTDALQMSYANVTKAVDEFNMLQEKISNAPAVDIIANLQRFFNEGLGLKGGEIKVNREPVQITINLQVNMKAEDIAKTMVETSLVTKGNKYDKLIEDGL